MFDSSLIQTYNIVSNSYPTTWCYNAGDDDLADVSAANYFSDMLYRVATGDKLLVKTETSGLSFSGTFTNDGTTVSVSWDNTLWIPLFLDDVSTASFSWVCAPAGIVTQFGGVLDTAITVASATVILKINTVDITGASLVFTDAMAAGTRVVATPTALNELAAAATLEVVTDGASTTTSRGNFFAKMICPAVI